MYFYSIIKIKENLKFKSFQYNILIKHKIMFVGRFPRLIEEWYILQELNDIAEKLLILMSTKKLTKLDRIYIRVFNQ